MQLFYLITVLVALVTGDEVKEQCDVSDVNQLNLNSEYGNKFEGDMILPNDLNYEKTGIKDKRYRWRKTYGLVEVPYVIDKVFSKSEKKIITKAMNEIQSKTCISFIPRTTEPDYINIVNEGGCWSFVGKISGVQKLSLSKSGCLHHGIIMHEIFHALGFGHQHNHHKRDEKVIVHWDNIICDQKHNFNIRDPIHNDNFETDYDIDSIMHYDELAFSKNGNLTIEARNKSDQNRMGQRVKLSKEDIIRINNMYNC